MIFWVGFAFFFQRELCFPKWSKHIPPSKATIIQFKRSKNFVFVKLCLNYLHHPFQFFLAIPHFNRDLHDPSPFSVFQHQVEPISKLLWSMLPHSILKLLGSMVPRWFLGGPFLNVCTILFLPLVFFHVDVFFSSGLSHEAQSSLLVLLSFLHHFVVPCLLFRSFSKVPRLSCWSLTKWEAKKIIHRRRNWKNRNEQSA